MIRGLVSFTPNLSVVSALMRTFLQGNEYHFKVVPAIPKKLYVVAAAAVALFALENMGAKPFVVALTIPYVVSIACLSNVVFIPI
jgi:hypothetical protein